ncbi:putative sterol carrier protein [Chitinivorax tropicus]|uniref:Putative sterol carrier protein n=1 Tax=Chitinivorax tropicus TaxID=714531 RepID=A0A840MLX7_9PROT|nr:SCP2 sterol-binding domain-containing protein [Chitinivorax tropicus]MBB5017536.1 putative sterol carrier protein [Chitinivorax tropicus]
MSLPSNIQELFQGLPARLKVADAAGKSSVFHFDLTGDGGGKYTVSLADGVCKVDDGLVGEAKCVVSAAASDYLDIELGKLRPEMAFMMGKIKISNLPEMMAFMQLFTRLA